MTFFFCEKDFWASVGRRRRVRSGPFEGDSAFMFFSSLFFIFVIFVVSQKDVSCFLSFSQIFFIADMCIRV